MKIRPSPTESATKFKVGTKHKGNDGRYWKVVETANGVKRWKVIDVNVKGTFKSFQFTKINKITDIGKFNATNNLGVGGDLIELTKFKAGIYYCYNVDDCLVVSRNQKITKEKLMNIKFKCVDVVELYGNAYFCFVDSGFLMEYYKNEDPKDYEKEMKKNKFWPTALPDFKFMKKDNYLLNKNKKDVGIMFNPKLGDYNYYYYTYNNEIAIIPGGNTYINICTQLKK